MSVSDVVAGGDLRRSLEAVRDRLATELDTASPKDAAAIARQLTAVLEKLDKLPGAGEVTPLDRIAGAVTDELAARRDRRPGAAGAGGATG